MSVRVVARIRPLLEKELDKDVIVHAVSNKSSSENDRAPYNTVKIPNPKNEAEEFSFAFNGVYDDSATQETLFSAEVNPHLKSLFQGLDVTIFAYGVTGTGKTHTMRGGLKLADRGVIPRLLSGVFRRAKKLAKDTKGETTVTVALSYYEIYNDKVYDLLEPPEKRTPSGLPLREANGKTQVVGLSERACEDLKDFERLYIEANTNRITASTKLNAHSSRSHAILRVKLTQTTGDTVRESTASAIDLAGSEDNRRTENGRERLIESAAINKSLFVLSQCIDAISRGDRRIPFRESKMTRILSLGQNNGITIMILNLAPLRSYHLDTLSSLNVSSRAKRIEVREIENEVVFKQPPRSTASTTGGTARQPLRPLANAHNIHTGTAAANANKPPADRPVKAFNVYTDKSKPATAPTTTTSTSRSANTAIKRVTASKRPSDGENNNNRPTKITRPAIPVPKSVSTTAAASAPKAPQISAADIEAMVEKKVQEILASRTAEAEAAAAAAAVAPPPPSPPRAEIDEAVQRRLEALERRIEDHDRHQSSRDGQGRSSDGLRYLLQARQHKERGDERGALRLYEMALPFFPGQAKLLGKIDKLKAKIAAGGGGGSGGSSSSPSKKNKKKSPRKAAASRPREDGEDTYADAGADAGADADADADADGDSETSGAETTDKARRSRGRKAGRGKKKATTTTTNADTAAVPATTTANDDNDKDDEDSTPAARALLAIVNTRDAAAIMGLQGFGPKKARDLVEYLRGSGSGSGSGDADADADGDAAAARKIESLAQLRAVPGMGGRAIARACEGLVSVGEVY